MAQTLSQAQTDGVVRRASGSATGTYTAADLTITLGFVPRYVKVINVTDRVTQEWFEGMNQGDFIETAANGVRTLETDDKLVVGAVGDSGTTDEGQFTIVANGGAITDNDTVVWVAEG